MEKAVPVWVDGRGLRVTARRMSAGLMIALMCNVSFSQIGWAQDTSLPNVASQNTAPQITAPQTTAPQTAASQNVAPQTTASLNVPLHTSTVNVIMGKSQDVRTDRAYADITVGNSDVADASPLTDHSISILGKKIGTTRVSVYDQDKRPVGVYDVEVSYDVTRLSVEVARISHGSIRVSSVDGRIMLSGTSPDAVTLDKVVQIARQFGPDVLNTVEVTEAQQVMLEVRFIEASRQASRELGVQWNVFGHSVLANSGNQLPASQLPITAPNGSFQQAALSGAGVGGPNIIPNQATISPVVAAGVLSGSTPFGFLVGQLIGGNNPLDVSINALEQRGLIRELAQPNLTALSGDTASFLAGGEYPIPIPGQFGSIAIEYKKYGVGLAFTPTVLNSGQINLVIKPNVSQIDPSHSVVIAGISIPALTVREASTTVELRDGQSFMLGGLLQNISQNNQDQLPWLGDVPVLGALFRSSAYQKNETDLVILVTPRLVHPLRPQDPVHTPLDSTLPGNDVDFFLMGNAEVSPALARLALGALNRPYVGHILDLPKKGGFYVSVKD
jgi:pilus assembly protein CpaC